MKGRVQNVIGALAGVTAIVTIAVFGYLTAVTPGGGLGWLGGSPSAEPSLEVGFPRVAIEEVVDNHYNFKLRAPGPEWRVFDQKTADPLWFDANAVMITDGGSVQLQVSRVGKIDLNRAEAIVIGWVGSQPDARRTLTWNSRDAVELKFGATRQRIVLRDGYMYRLLLLPYSGREFKERALPGVWGSLTLLDGPLTPVSFTPAPLEARGLDWRIERGRWESVAAHVAIAPPSGWRLVVGRTLRGLDNDLDVELIDTACGCFVSLQSDAEIDSVKRIGATITAEIAGAPRKLEEIEPSRLMRKWVSQLDVDGIPIVVSVLAPAADGDDSLASIRRALAAITELDPGGVDELATALAATPYTPTVIGDDWVERNGTFVHYPSGLVWARPPGVLWKASLPDDDVDSVPDDVLSANRLGPPLSFAIVPDDTIGSRDNLVSWLHDNYTGKTKKVDLAPWRSDLGQGAEVSWVDHGVRAHRVGLLTGDNGKAFRVHVWGPRKVLEGEQAAITSALAGLAIVSVPAVETSGEYLNRRWGFGIDLPGWKRADRFDTDGLIDVQWALGATEQIGITVETTGSATSPVTIAEARNLASAAVGDGADLPPSRGQDTLGGESATRLHWHEGKTFVAVLIVEHHGLVYTLFARGTESTLARAKRVFRFVDPA